jgi:hypothetical protein
MYQVTRIQGNRMEGIGYEYPITNNEFQEWNELELGQQVRINTIPRRRHPWRSFTSKAEYP